jgi:Raf kinase inhibitor-like YbhB/YbcL family protein
VRLTSSSFNDGDYLSTEHALAAAYEFGCAGGNRSPHLAWSDAPAGTRSFAVTVFDPDAPTGCGFWHWIVVNIPPDVHELPLDAGSPAAGHLPPGALQIRNDFSTREYGGPCPPAGDHPHRYVFTIHAVGEAQLAATEETSAAVISFQLHFKSLDQATLLALYRH